MEVNGPDHGRAEHEELHVGVGRLARLEKIAEFAPDRPVDVLARAIDAREGLLVQQAGHAILLRHPRQRLHDRLLMVGRDVGIFVHRSDLILRRRHFVVTRLHRHAQLEQFPLSFEHAGQDPLRDRPEILVLELLPLRRLGAEERSAGYHEVGTGKEEIPVDEEVFLLRTG